jgi:hypothetical protein
MPEVNTRWDIFCTVVDNYGDIGVTWRLARQLVAEHSLAVRLWVDDLRAFERICPDIDVNAAQQWQQGVEVRHWPSEWAQTDAADVVIAAFACQLPSDYMDAMAAREKRTVMDESRLPQRRGLGHRLPRSAISEIQIGAEDLLFPGLPARYWRLAA